jgi:hypothetical protein
VWPIHLNFLFLISRFISSCSVTLHKSLLEIMFGHHILKMYLGHRLTKTCILRLISLVTSHVSHPQRSTDYYYYYYYYYDAALKDDWKERLRQTVCVKSLSKLAMYKVIKF